MPKLRFRMIDVFTEVRFGGNPLGVFFDADEIDAAIMQTMARELNMSEIVFLSRPTDPANTARVRIFTPELEIAFAGHPNVGVGWALAEDGLTGPFRLEQPAGIVTVEVDDVVLVTLIALVVVCPLSVTVCKVLVFQITTSPDDVSILVSVPARTVDVVNILELAI